MMWHRPNDYELPIRPGRILSSKPVLYIATSCAPFEGKPISAILRDRLGSTFDVYAPEEDGFTYAQLTGNGMDPEPAHVLTLLKNVSAVRACDIFLVIDDGISRDRAPHFDHGLAYALGKPCWRLCQAARIPSEDQPDRVGAAVHHHFKSLDDLLIFSESFAQTFSRAIPSSAQSA
jgi:nucleoside 2-deoxyribosyltransferase